MSGALRAEDGHSHRHGAAAPDSAADGTHGSSHGHGQEPLGFVGKHEGCTLRVHGSSGDPGYFSMENCFQDCRDCFCGFVWQRNELRSNMDLVDENAWSKLPTRGSGFLGGGRTRVPRRREEATVTVPRRVHRFLRLREPFSG